MALWGGREYKADFGKSSGSSHSRVVSVWESTGIAARGHAQGQIILTQVHLLSPQVLPRVTWTPAPFSSSHSLDLQFCCLSFLTPVLYIILTLLRTIGKLRNSRCIIPITSICHLILENNTFTLNISRHIFPSLECVKLT